MINGNAFFRKQCRKCERAVRNNAAPREIVIGQALAEIEEEIDMDSILKMTFEVSEAPYEKELVDNLVINSRTLLAAFLKYREYVAKKLGGRPRVEGTDDYHCVYGEELNLIENGEGIY